MQFERKMQYDVLAALAEVYPDSLLVANLPGFSSDRVFMRNLFYLQEHGLIAGGDIREPGQCRSMVDAQITQNGLDFLADDGGLPAILGQSVIKFDKDALITVLDDSLKNGETGGKQRKGVVTRLETLEPEIFKKTVERILAESGRRKWCISLLQKMVDKDKRD